MVLRPDAATKRMMTLKMAGNNQCQRGSTEQKDDGQLTEKSEDAPSDANECPVRLDQGRFLLPSN